MQAIVWTKYGGPEGLELRELEQPTPKADEILIRLPPPMDGQQIAQ